MPAATRRLRCAAVIGLAAALAVVLASAAIRLNDGGRMPFLDDFGIDGTRLVHRGAASLAALAVLAVVLLAWRLRGLRTAATAAALLTVVLSVIGVAAGRAPPATAALANFAGGLALVACLAWLATARGDDATASGRWRTLAWLVPQVLAGGALSIFGREDHAAMLLAHLVLGVVLAFAAVREAQRQGSHWSLPVLALVALALAVPLAGLVTLREPSSAAAAFAHAAAAALFVTAWLAIARRQA